MTTFIIWANTIPDAHRYFLTPGKRYEASRWGEFFDDEGDEVQAVLLGPSNLLDGDEWQMSPLDRLRLWFVSRCGAVHVWWWRRAR